MTDNLTTAFERWRWAPRTAESAIDRAYPVLHYPNDTSHRHTAVLYWVAIGIGAGVALGYALARSGPFL
jgi:hypothetical protein